MGVRSAAVDAMIAAMLRARERTDFVAAVRALDRVLISGCYVVPLFYLPQQWVARWTIHRASGADIALRLSAGNLVASAATERCNDPWRSSASRDAGAATRAAAFTIDEVFRHVAQRRPEALALADPPNRESFHRRPRRGA